MLYKPTTTIHHKNPQPEPKLRENPSLIARHVTTNSNMANHSNDNLVTIEEFALDRCSPNKEYCDSQIEFGRCCLIVREAQCKLHKKEDQYGNESIVRKRVEVDVYGGEGRADLKFKCVRDTQGLMEAVGRTIGRMRIFVVLMLFLTMLATCSAAPAPRTRHTRTAHQDKSVRNYLEQFGYLDKDSLKVANLVMGEGEYEDEFRIAVKTLQHYGGIPVTGEVDAATVELMGKKRCGRPDVESGSTFGRRRKRFAVQGEKWKHTNLTWSLSSFRRPSQLEPGHTRSVLARALDVWGQASRLTFTEINSDEADIVVSFAKRYHDDAYPFDGRGSILAHAFFPGTGKGGDAHFDDEELWLLQPKNDDEEGTSLFAVAAHEFGHSLGLSHSSVRGALMFPWYQGGIQSDYVLPEDDRNGIQQMYGPKENKRPWARIPSYRPADTPPPTTSTTTTTTKRPYIHHRHPNRHPNHQPGYTPYPRDPSKYPSYYPERPSHERPNYPERPTYPNRPTYPDRPYYPDRRHHNTTHTTHTTHTTTRRPHYPNVRPEYPSYRPYNPSDKPHEYPKKKPIYPERTTVRPTTPSDKPDTCDTTYDAVALIRGELFIFKNRYHWRIGANGRYASYPIEISRMWPQLPKDMTHVDAVYERPDKKIAFFIGKELYLFDSQYLAYGYPKPITHLGLPESLDKIDAAMVWGHNGKTYFYSGTMYWKFDEDEGRVELDYPRDMSMWKGVGYNIDSVFQWKDGKTYFFKGKGFWKFNDLQMRVEHERQLPSAPFWMGCPAEPTTGRRAPYRAPQAPGSTLRSPSAANTHSLNATSLLTSILLVLLSYARYS